MTKQPLSHKEFKQHYSRVPRLCVDLVIKGPNGTLLTHRSIPPNVGQWHLPGGTVRFKEPLLKAIARIAKDEVGVGVSVKGYLGYMEFFNQDKAGGFDYPVSIVFLCSAGNDNFQTNEEASEAKYFKELPDNMLPEHKIFLEKL